MDPLHVGCCLVSRALPLAVVAVDVQSALQDAPTPLVPLSLPCYSIFTTLICNENRALP